MRSAQPSRDAIVALFSLLVFVHSFVGTALAQKNGKDEEARVLFQAAQMAFTDGRYEDALEYFEKSYELSGRPGLLFNIGTTADRLRLEERALEAFRQYLVELPDAENRREVESRIRIIERALEERGAQPEPDPAPQPTLDPQRTAVSPEPGPERAVVLAAEQPAAEPQPEKKRLVKKWWFWTIIGVAAAGLVVGGAAAASSGGEVLKSPVPGDDGNVIYTLSFGN